MEQEQASVIQAASNNHNGVAAAAAGRRLRRPVLYEVRGLWEVTRVSREPDWEGSKDHRVHLGLETQAAKAADRVVTITGGLKDELVHRGVEETKITLTTNSASIQPKELICLTVI